MAETYVDLPISESAYVTDAHPEDNISNLSQYTLAYGGGTQLILMQFQPVASAIMSKRLYRIEARGSCSTSGNVGIRVYAITADFIPGLVTWQTKPTASLIGRITTVSSGNNEYALPAWTGTASENSSEAARALHGYGVAFGKNATDVSKTFYMSGVVLRVYYDDSASATSQVTISNAPTSGYVNPRTATSFAWQFKPSGTYYPVSPYVQSSATFYWRVKNASTWNSVGAGTSKTKSISANTFPTASTIQWYVSATDTYGTTSTTPTYEISTAAGAVTATPVSPADSVEDNSAAITFNWNVTSADGQAQSGSELQYSNGSGWTALGTVSGSGTSYVCPANTLQSGTLYWRVRASNIDGTAGAWSSAASFVSFGAPQAPTVTVVSGNFPLIRWQTDVQEAYRVTVAGKTYGPVFGTEKSLQLTDPLSAGDYTAEVEVQNSFGLWSTKGTANFTVTQMGRAKPHITASKFGVDAIINYTISNVSTTNEVFIYRDGVKIASMPVKETGTLVDRYVLGNHSYQVIVRVGNYYAAYSPEQVSGTIKVCGAPRIAPFSGGEWMKLRLSETTRRTEGFSRQRQVSLRHFTGAEYPVAEVSPYTDASGSYDCAFETVEEANAFEALFGQVVILKTKANNVIIGVLSNYEKRVSRHYIAYTFTIQRIYWRDYLDLTTD